MTVAIKKIHETPVGAKCAVRIYRNHEYDEYIVKSVVNGKVQGGKDGGYFTSDKADAHGTAAFEVKRLQARPACQVSLAARPRRRRKKQKRRG
jgi:hypothetical protein